jgi:hypothetical protein
MHYMQPETKDDREYTGYSIANVRLGIGLGLSDHVIKVLLSIDRATLFNKIKRLILEL